MFDPFERVARAHHVCPCCERPFSAEEEDEFVKKVVIYHIGLPEACHRFFIHIYLLTRALEGGGDLNMGDGTS